MKKLSLFHNILGNTLLAGIANNFIWFALVFWAYLETRSVLVTSLIGGLYLVAILVSGIFFGSIVDHHKKKHVMLGSSIVSLFFFVVTGALFFSSPSDAFTYSSSPMLWILVVFTMLGVVVGNIRYISMSTMVTLLFDPENRDKANGQVGIANGIAFGIVSVFSGLTIGQLGMGWAIIITIITTVPVIFHLSFLRFPDEPAGSSVPGANTNCIETSTPSHQTGLVSQPITEPSGSLDVGKIDLRGTIRTITGISGLWGLILFTMFNNFLGGVFMSLMDAYGLSLVSVEVWGFIWGFLSFGFIIGGLLVSTWGLGKNPLRTLLLTNVVLWFVCIFFTAYSSIILTTFGLLIFMSLHPYIEAAEQTILQKVVPFERQGRVFGFAQSIEQTASPITAFFIGPIAEFLVIPFMASATGVSIFGSWFGTTPDRAMALIFSAAGLIGLSVSVMAFRTRSYTALSKSFLPEASSRARQ